MNVQVILSGRHPYRTIEMSMEEYQSFIKEQAELLGIVKKDKSINMLVGMDTSEQKDFTITPPRFYGKTMAKSSLDEIVKEINKQKRRNEGC